MTPNPDYVAGKLSAASGVIFEDTALTVTDAEYIDDDGIYIDSEDDFA